jgi:hypothetical protein
VNAALTKDIEMRYQSAEEMRVDLVDYERGRPLTFAYEPGAVAAPGETAPPTVAAAVAQSVLPPQHHRKRGWGGVIAAIIALGLLGAVVVSVLINTSEKKKDTPTVEVPNVVGQRSTPRTPRSRSRVHVLPPQRRREHPDAGHGRRPGPAGGGSPTRARRHAHGGQRRVGGPERGRPAVRRGRPQFQRSGLAARARASTPTRCCPATCSAAIPLRTRAWRRAPR